MQWIIPTFYVKLWFISNTQKCPFHQFPLPFLLWLSTTPLLSPSLVSPTAPLCIGQVLRKGKCQRRVESYHSSPPSNSRHQWKRGGRKRNINGTPWEAIPSHKFQACASNYLLRSSTSDTSSVPTKSAYPKLNSLPSTLFMLFLLCFLSQWVARALTYLAQLQIAKWPWILLSVFPDLTLTINNQNCLH